MPASTGGGSRAEELTARLGAGGAAAGEGLLRALREVKNQIIGNRTKKRLYLHLGAVPRIVSVLASAVEAGDSGLVVQSAAAIGSFACGVEDGARAVLDAGAVPLLLRTLSSPDDKVVNAGARSLRMIFQSKLAPKYDILQEENIGFLVLLLNSENANVAELAACIIAHSCEMNAEQRALCDAGVLERLFTLLESSLNQRDASLDAIAAVVKNNSEVASKFTCISNGKALGSLIELIKDRHPGTRLLACACLIAIRHALPSSVQNLEIETKMIPVLVELLEEPGQVGDDAPFALSNLISGEEELQKQAVSVNAVVKLCNFLNKSPIQSRRLEGILLVLAELCSKLEKCRCELMTLQVLNVIADSLKHDCADVRIAACACIRSLSRSVKNLSAGSLSTEAIVVPLVHLLHDPSISMQVAALEALSNVAVDFTARKSVFIESGGVKQLVLLSKSMDHMLRLKAVWALRNLIFLADRIHKESILLELTVTTLTSLICDSEPSIQEQALALVRNLVGGCADTVNLVFAEDGIILNAATRQLHGASSPEVCIQGMLFFSNIAAGSEVHKEAVMGFLVPVKEDGCPPSCVVKFLQSKNSLLRTAALWCIVNLTYPGSLSLSNRIARLQDAGIISQLKAMVNDPCLDAKYRVRMALEQCTIFESNSA